VNGHVYIVFASNPGNGDSSDVFFTRSTDGGATWSTPGRVNDDATPNDQFFPAIAVNAAGTIEAIWYDRRLDPDNFHIDVFRARSTDDGATFEANERVTSASFLPAVGFGSLSSFDTDMGASIDIKAGRGPSGRTDSFYLTWTDCRRRIVTPQGTRPDQDIRFVKD
jgi:hypothetical protein